MKVRLSWVKRITDANLDAQDQSEDLNVENKKNENKLYTPASSALRQVLV